jgi:hypothetical protein
MIRKFILTESEKNEIKSLYKSKGILITEGLSLQQNQVVLSFENCGNIASLILTLGGQIDENGRIPVSNIEIGKQDESGLNLIDTQQAGDEQQLANCPNPAYYEQFLKGAYRQINSIAYNKDWSDMAYTYDEMRDQKWKILSGRENLEKYSPEKIEQEKETQGEVEITPIDQSSIRQTSGGTEAQKSTQSAETGQVSQTSGQFQLSKGAKINTTNDKSFDYALDNGKYYFKGKGSYTKKYPNWKEAKGSGLESIKSKVKF